jgi:hypothetical protein
LLTKSKTVFSPVIFHDLFLINYYNSGFPAREAPSPGLNSRYCEIQNGPVKKSFKEKEWKTIGTEKLSKQKKLIA